MEVQCAPSHFGLNLMVTAWKLKCHHLSPFHQAPAIKETNNRYHAQANQCHSYHPNPEIFPTNTSAIFDISIVQLICRHKSYFPTSLCKKLSSCMINQAKRAGGIPDLQLLTQIFNQFIFNLLFALTRDQSDKQLSARQRVNR